MFAFVYCDTGTNGVKGMDTWADIGAGVRAVQPSHDSGKDIASSECVKIRAKVMSVWPDCINSQADCHTNKQKRGDPVKFCPVFEKEIGDCYKNIGEP